MDSQILLNVNFCNDVYARKIEKNDRSVYVRAGYSIAGIRLVPQENAGVCMVCVDGHVRAVKLNELDRAVYIDESCSFISVELDPRFNRDALHSGDLHPLGRLLTNERKKEKYSTEGLLESILKAAADHIEDSGSLWCDEAVAADDIVKLAKMIYSANGKISISELAEQMGCTVRHVHRRLAEELGVGPKRFARIVRIRETARKMLEHPGGHVTDYMDDMGYSDQAHFQREFKWYTGMTPGSLLKMLGDRAG